jgi:cobalt-precorrin-7 (C5)-methyltransferase
MSKLYLVGIGPGSGKYLTKEAEDVVNSSEIVIGSNRALKLFPDMNAEKIELNAQNMEKMLKLAVSKAADDNRVALLSTGDPGFSGLLKPIQKIKGNLDLEVVPGISSIQLCAAKLQIPWDEANIITMHGKGFSSRLLPLLSNGRPTIILPNTTINETVNYLMEKEIDSSRAAAVCENLSYENEKVVKAKLGELLAEKFGYMCVLVVY